MTIFKIAAAKLRKNEQNTKQKRDYFHFCLYFRTKVPSNVRSNLQVTLFFCIFAPKLFNKEYDRTDTEINRHSR